MELVDGVSWVDTSGGQHSASRWTASQMLRMMKMGNAGKIIINGYTIPYEKIYVSLEDDPISLAHESPSTGCPDLFPQSWMHL